MRVTADKLYIPSVYHYHVHCTWVAGFILWVCFRLVILLGILLLTASRHIIYIILYIYTYIGKNVIDKVYV